MKSHRKTVVLLGLAIMCMFMLPVSAYQFSMTNVENYDSQTDLYPDGTNSHAYLYNWLTGQGWSQAFYDIDANVDDTDFATSGGGLNNADLHYHYGHGDWISRVGYLDYSNYPTSSLIRTEVYKKWGTSLISANKWVVLDSCWALLDLQWSGALRHSHGILGFGNIKYSDPALTNSFLNNCITYNYSLYTAWQSSTQSVLFQDGTLVRVIFDTEDQLNNDHLPGHGTVAASEIIDDDTAYYDYWYT
jgi:hypothetical protein